MRNILAGIIRTCSSLPPGKASKEKKSKWNGGHHQRILPLDEVPTSVQADKH